MTVFANYAKMHEEKSEEFITATRKGIADAQRRLDHEDLSEETQMFLRYHLAIMKKSLGEL